MLFNITRIVDSELTILPRPFIPYDIVSRPMTHWLAGLNYICLFDVWAHAFDKFQWALTFASVTWWMYSFWLQCFNFCCVTFIEICSSMFNKMHRALIGFDLHSTASFDM